MPCLNNTLCRQVTVWKPSQHNDVEETLKRRHHRRWLNVEKSWKFTLFHDVETTLVNQSWFDMTSILRCRHREFFSTKSTTLKKRCTLAGNVLWPFKYKCKGCHNNEQSFLTRTRGSVIKKRLDFHFKIILGVHKCSKLRTWEGLYSAKYASILWIGNLREVRYFT